LYDELEFEDMLRARLATNLLFNVVLALWVLHDARTRHARKPVFASALTLLWGPLGLGLWASDRPLAAGETRQGTARTIAGTFLLAWTVLVPAIFVLVIPDMLDRSAVPGSFPRRVGVTLASAIVTTAIWVGPAIVAVLLGSLADGPGTPESGRSDVVVSRPSLAVACVLGGIAALAFALLITR
jgi:hypothetical protein